MKRLSLLIIGVAILLGVSVHAETYTEGRRSAFELGKRNYEAGNYVRALELFGQAISFAQDAPGRNRAYYFQGLTLFEMGHYYSSYISFRNVLLAADDKNKEVYEKAIKNAVSITDRMDMVERVGKVLEKLPASLIPVSVTAHAHYAIGVYLFEAGNVDQAAAHFKSVNPESIFYPKALFYLGVISVKTRSYREASFYNEKILDITKGKKELFPLAELARLNLARIAYSGGDIERSIELYSQFLSSSPHWLTVLLEASWPLMRVSDTTVSLGNLHTLLSPFYREDLIAEAYVLRSTILFSLCKYEEMRQTLALFFSIYDPILRDMQKEQQNYATGDGFYRAFDNKKLSRAFLNFIKRDQGVQKQLRVLEMLRDERRSLATYRNSEQIRRMAQVIDETDRALSQEIGSVLQRLHRRKLQELIEWREQANYLKVEIVTGEKELIEGQRGLPPRRIVDVETSVASGYNFWPFHGEFWEDELGTYVYTTESSCVN